MQTIYFSSQIRLAKEAVATVGVFDGVHIGHRALIGAVVSKARKEGAKSMVITFDKHPREVLNIDGYCPEMLTTLEQRLSLIAALGVDICVVLPFTEALSRLTARDFMEIMRRKLSVKWLIIGYDHRFGKPQGETIFNYIAYGQELGIHVSQGKVSTKAGEPVSSSMVRAFVKEGEMEFAKECLLRPYSLTSRIVTGTRRGHSLGFATANFAVSNLSGLAIPKAGVYAVSVEVLDEGGADNTDQETSEETPLHTAETGENGGNKPLLGMTNIGSCPTFGGGSMTIETHILGFNADIYGKQMRISFLRRIRDERQFASENALKRQLERDREAVLAMTNEDKA